MSKYERGKYLKRGKNEQSRKMILCGSNLFCITVGLLETKKMCI